MGIFKILKNEEIPERPIIEIPLEVEDIRLFIKREDQTHPEVSGNKFWKLLYNIEHYLASTPIQPLLITFGGAYSNHIAATATVGHLLKIPTKGIIRSEELTNCWQHNPTLMHAYEQGMQLEFVSRTAYRNKAQLSAQFIKQYPEAIIIPEGGSNSLAVEGVQGMLSEETKTFDYLCTAVGTGGTVAGLSKFAAPHQKVMGFKVVNDPCIEYNISLWNGKKEIPTLIDAYGAGYGKFSDEIVSFINSFWHKHQIPLEPIYTGKMLFQLYQLIQQNYFPKGSKILAFHTGGLQGIKGANEMLKKQKRNLINIPI